MDLFQDVPLDNLFYQDFFDPPSRGGEDGGGASSEGEGVSSEGECEDSGGGSGEGEQVGCEGGDLSLFEKKQVKVGGSGLCFGWLTSPCCSAEQCHCQAGGRECWGQALAAWGGGGRACQAPQQPAGGGPGV